MLKLFKAINENFNKNKSAVLVSITASSGSTPRGSGAMMAVFDDGHSIGTIGGGAVEFAAQKRAAELVKTGVSESMSYVLRPNDVADLGMICGGDVTVYFQYLDPSDSNKELFAYLEGTFARGRDAWLVRRLENGRMTENGVFDGELRFIDDRFEDQITPYLKKDPVSTPSGWRIEPVFCASRTYVFGGGHVSQEVVPVLAHLGFNVTVYEDREDFCKPELFPGVERTVLASFNEIAQNVTIGKNDYVVIMTRGHQADFEVLEQTLHTPAAYIGCIGSRAKIATTKRRLAEKGISNDEYEARVHSPIGLQIKAETPAEIAISVAGEMIEFRASMGK